MFIFIHDSSLAFVMRTYTIIAGRPRRRSDGRPISVHLSNGYKMFHAPISRRAIYLHRALWEARLSTFIIFWDNMCNLLNEQVGRLSSYRSDALTLLTGMHLNS